MEKFSRFARIAEIEFGDLILSTQDLGAKLRIYLIDTSFIDFFYTTRLEVRRFSIHWERRHLNNGFYRLDNTPDKKWKFVKTFPIHFHNRSYEKVEDAEFMLKKAEELENIFRLFLKWADGKISRRRME